MTPHNKLYRFMAMIAEHIKDKKSKFICVIGRGEDGKFEVYFGDIVDIDELAGLSNAIKEIIEDIKNNN